MRALIIEPQVFTSFMIEDALRDAGFDSIALAATEEEAVACAEAEPPDLVTAAVELQRGSGLSAVERIRARFKVPVLFITEHRPGPGAPPERAGRQEAVRSRPAPPRHLGGEGGGVSRRVGP